MFFFDTLCTITGILIVTMNLVLLSHVVGGTVITLKLSIRNTEQKVESRKIKYIRPRVMYQSV